ncbi:hypothetical protein HDU96_010476, partial [Phlyctochytrium bullatum]
RKRRKTPTMPEEVILVSDTERPPTKYKNAERSVLISDGPARIIYTFPSGGKAAPQSPKPEGAPRKRRKARTAKTGIPSEVIEVSDTERSPTKFKDVKRVVYISDSSPRM